MADLDFSVGGPSGIMVSEKSVAKDLLELPEIIGLPSMNDNNLVLPSAPDSPTLQTVARDSMPILELIPSMPKIETSLSAYSMNDYFTIPSGKTSYLQELQNLYGITANTSKSPRGLMFAFQANTTPTESFTNEFASSALEGLSSATTDNIRNLMFMTGSQDISHFAKQMKDVTQNLKDSAQGQGGVTETLFDLLNSAASGVSNATDTVSNAFKKSDNKAIGAIGEITSAMISGKRIDFPQVWSSSSYSPSYSFRIRLYNPAPGDTKTTMRFIAGPIAALLMFVVPRTDDGYTYNWPWMLKFRCKGLIPEMPGYVKNITIVKGGDDSAIAYNQRPGIVDINLDLGVLFNVMINKVKPDSQAPSLQKYIREYASSKWEDGETPLWMLSNSTASALVASDTITPTVRTTSPSGTVITVERPEPSIPAPTVPVTTTERGSTLRRISDRAKSTYDNLKGLIRR